MKTTSNKKIMTKKQKIWAGIAAFVVVTAGWWAFVNFMPHPLGDRLEYLGKVDSGGGLFFRDYAPSSNYYYGTDMNETEITQYFQNAHYEPTPNDLGGHDEDYSYRTVHYSSASGTFSVQYYSDINIVSKILRLSPSTKKNLISVSDADYNIALQTLE